MPEKHEKIHRFKGYKLVILACLFALILISMTFIYIYIYRSQYDPIPLNVRQAVSFHLYYPTNLPKLYHLDTTSYTVNSKKQVIFSYRDNSSDILYIVQETNPGLDTVNNFISANISNPQITTARIGSFSTGRLYNNPQIDATSLIISDNWTVIYSNNNLGDSSLYQLINSLKTK